MLWKGYLLCLNHYSAATSLCSKGVSLQTTYSLWKAWTSLLVRRFPCQWGVYSCHVLCRRFIFPLGVSAWFCMVLQGFMRSPCEPLHLAFHRNLTLKTSFQLVLAPANCMGEFHSLLFNIQHPERWRSCTSASFMALWKRPACWYEQLSLRFPMEWLLLSDSWSWPGGYSSWRGRGFGNEGIHSVFFNNFLSS